MKKLIVLFAMVLISSNVFAQNVAPGQQVQPQQLQFNCAAGNTTDCASKVTIEKDSVAVFQATQALQVAKLQQEQDINTFLLGKQQSQITQDTSTMNASISTSLGVSTNSVAP